MSPGIDILRMIRHAANRKDILVSYLNSCIQVEDWHGVSDAANDLREVEVELKGLDAQMKLWRSMRQADKSEGGETDEEG